MCQATPVSRSRPGKTALFLFFAATLLLAAGCGEEAKVEAVTIKFDGHPVLAGALAQPLAHDLRFHAFGKTVAGFTGDKQPPAPDAKVAFRILEEPEGANASFEPAETVTDAGGLAIARFRVGDKPGLYRVEAKLADRPEIAPATVSIIGGAMLSGDGQDGWIGQGLDHRLAVRLESAPGVYLEPDQGVVRFDLRSDPGGTVLTDPLARTDEDGFASTAITLGKNQGLGEIGVSIRSGIPGVSGLAVYLPATFFAIDGWIVAVSILGGVALFLFGMHMMSDGLQHVAGDKLRALLNTLTKNRFLAVCAGAGVTALIQSSSACTVMVVGFVNAGLMRLEQAIGVTMGANIGTTITAQIISFKLSALALPAITVGVVLSFVARRQSTRYWSGILIGFGILFLGMSIMSNSLSEMRNSASMISLFRGLDCTPGISGYVPPLQFFKAVGVGLAVTLVLQSSAATIGMLFVIANAGLIDPYAAFGILLGDNIGTTITAVLASIGSSRTAKRAACFHVMFNVLGVVIMMILNFVQLRPGKPIFMDFVNVFTPGDVFKGENLTRFLANAHTLFNISCTLIFLPFVNQFAALTRLIFKDKEGDQEGHADARRILDPHLLSTPSLAMQQVWTEVGVMLAKGREAQADGFKAIISTDTPDWDDLAKTTKRLEQETDELQAAVTNYLSNIPLTGMNESQSEMFPRMIRTVNDAERVGDLGRHLSKMGKRVKKRSLPFTPDAVEEMETMSGIVREILLLAEKTVALNADGIETTGGGGVLRKKFLEQGKALDKTAKAKASEFRKRHEARHEAGDCDIRSGVIFMDVVNTLARSAGHALNVIEAACYVREKPGKK